MIDIRTVELHLKGFYKNDKPTGPLPIDSIWKLNVSSADSFLLDFNLPCKFTILMQPVGKLVEMKQFIKII